MEPTLVIYRCGCSSNLRIASTLNKASVAMTAPDGVESFALTINRISAVPSVFVEEKQERPEWALDYHAMTAFDIRVFDDADWKNFEHLFGPIREQFGPMVPTCWMPEMLGGRGRFYGLWRSQRQVKARAFGHLRVIDGTEETKIELVD